jgi:hypothetical protein
MSVNDSDFFVFAVGVFLFTVAIKTYVEVVLFLKNEKPLRFNVS